MSVAPPKLSYIIWFSQRVGSTVLTQTLEDTGIAGRPREWLNDPAGAGLLAKYGVGTPAELREYLWREATTANGVLGVKHSMTEAGDAHIAALFGGVLSGAPDPDGTKAWEAFYPNCKHVFMTRRNKLRLAVSWWRAIQSGEWHRPNRVGTAFGEASSGSTTDVVVDQYKHEAIEHLLVEATMREVAIQERFESWGVIPHTITYEDLVASYDRTVRGVLGFLELEHAQLSIPAPSFDRLADEISDAWYERFRRSRSSR